MQKLMPNSWMDVQYCGSCHGLQVELCNTSPTTSVDTSKVIWIQVMSTCCSTDTLKEGSIKESTREG